MKVFICENLLRFDKVTADYRAVPFSGNGVYVLNRTRSTIKINRKTETESEKKKKKAAHTTSEHYVAKSKTLTIDC